MTLLEAYGFSTHAQLVAWIVKTYGLNCTVGSEQFMNDHRMRREKIGQRLRLYRDDGRTEFERVIKKIFTKSDVQEQRIAMIEVASELNVTQRITNEVASLYDQPAVRELATKEETEKYKEVALALQLDEVMQQAQRLTFLCNETLLWRTRADDGLGEELRIITPDAFDAVPHPKRKLTEIAFIIDASPAFVPEGTEATRLPHYEMWDDKFKYLISGDGRLVKADGSPADAPEEHGLTRIPGVLLHREKPVDRLLDDRAGRDITSAHLGVGLLEVMAMRLMKSQGERQPILKGNLASMAMGQSMDGERPLLLPPEVTADMLDTQTDPDHYMRKKRDKISGVGTNYGMSYEQFVFSETADTSSGKAYTVRRLKLTEIRNEQRRRWIVHERMIARLLDFDPTRMTADFQEQTVPQDASEEIALLKEKVALGLDSPVQFYMRKNPDVTRQQALDAIRRNLNEYAIIILEVRALNMPANANADNPGQSPQQNGAMGGPKGSEDPESDQDTGTGQSASAA